MNKYYLMTVIGLFSFSLLVTSCKKDEDPDPEPVEFVADNATFNGISTWTLGGEFFGMDPALGGAHGGNDSTVTRSVYFKADVAPSNGAYPTGAVITKYSHNTGGTLSQYTAMVKRGGDFNTTGNGWEYFMLAGEGEIAKDSTGAEMRGANLLNGMCVSCHINASTDYIFTAR